MENIRPLGHQDDCIARSLLLFYNGHKCTMMSLVYCVAARPPFFMSESSTKHLEDCSTICLPATHKLSAGGRQLCSLCRKRDGPYYDHLYICSRVAEATGERLQLVHQFVRPMRAWLSLWGVIPFVFNSLFSSLF